MDHLVHKWGASPVAIFSPSSIPNLQLWLDASDTSSISKNSSNQVSQWNDKSGNGRNVSQSGANNIKPTFSSNSMKFNGSQYLFNTTPFMYSNGSIEIFMVASGNTQSDTRILCEGSSSSNNPFYAFQINNTAPQNKLAAYIRNTPNSTRRSQGAILNDISHGWNLFPLLERYREFSDCYELMVGHPDPLVTPELEPCLATAFETVAKSFIWSWVHW